MYLSSVNEIKTTWPGHVLYHLLVKLFHTCEVIEESLRVMCTCSALLGALISNCLGTGELTYTT